MGAEKARTKGTGRGADWWMHELRYATQDVATAETIAEKEPRLAWVLEQREEHLAMTEERVEQILAGIREVSEPWVAEAARQHFVYGRTWSETAKAAGWSIPWVFAKYREAVRKLDEAD